MRSAVLAVLLVLVAVAFAQQQTNGFLPPTALQTSDEDVNISPLSPQSTVQVDPPTRVLYQLSPVTPDSPVPFSVVTLPSAFNYNDGPFRPYTKIDGRINQHLNAPSLSPFSIQDFSPLAPLFGSHASNDAGVQQVGFTVMGACLFVAMLI